MSSESEASRIKIVRIDASKAAVYKAIRLAALATDPGAFCSTYDREAAFPDDEWIKRATTLDGIDRIGYLACADAGPCGLIACFRDSQRPNVAEVISVWVSPAMRRNGIAVRLLDAVRTWARVYGIETLRLLVTSTNAAGAALYERYGFTRTGLTRPSSSHPGTEETEWSCPTHLAHDLSVSAKP